MKMLEKAGSLAVTFGLLVGALLFAAPTSGLAADTLCATVKIEIAQTLTLERQGFDAHMRINNGQKLPGVRSCIATFLICFKAKSDPIAFFCLYNLDRHHVVKISKNPQEAALKIPLPAQFLPSHF